MTDWEMLRFKEEVIVERLISFLYMELPKHFQASGEKHDFWEFVYVDKGEVLIITDLGSNHLRQGDMIFYSPNEYHTGHAINGTAPNLIIMSFACHSPAIDYFRGRVLHLEQSEQDILYLLISEGKEAFAPPVGHPKMMIPQRKEGALFGSEQMIKNLLEMLLIRLIRKQSAETGKHRPESVLLATRNEDLFERIALYLKDNVRSNLSFEQICSEFAIGSTILKNLFKSRANSGVMEYYSKLKLEFAKRQIREKMFSMTEIADQLGYSSVHYFSKHFKKATGFTPTEYARMIAGKTSRKRVPQSVLVHGGDPL